MLEETGLLPHLNPGVMSRDDLVALRPVSASMGIMLETTAERLSAKGGPHWASPDKEPSRRLETIDLAGELRIPFTSGILIGIGETRAERLAALEELRALHERHGHLQEVIVQNFRAKPGTRMASHPEPSLDDHLWTIAVGTAAAAGGRCRSGAAESRLRRLSAPARRRHRRLGRRLARDDRPRQPRGAVARPRPARRGDAGARARARAAPAGVPALPLRRVGRPGRAADGAARVRRARARPRGRLAPRRAGRRPVRRSPGCAARSTAAELGEEELVRLFQARGEERQRVFAAADRLRREVCGDEVSYVVTRNIQYTNVCYFRCGFCAFSKGRLAANLRGAPYLVPLDEIVRRAREAWDRGATEVCLQGGIHPAFTGDYYASVVEAIRAELPDLHIHAFSALEVWQGAETLGLSLEDYLARLRALGLGSLPGTAAEILDDEVRAVICPDKVSTEQWLSVHAAAHRVGLRSNVTIMFGHVEAPEHWARHLLRARAQQERSGLHGVRAAAGRAHGSADVAEGAGPFRADFGESLLVHAVARLALHPAITNIQASWVKLGPEESRLRQRRRERSRRHADERVDLSLGRIGARQEMPPQSMEALIWANGRSPRQRTTLYADASAERRAASFAAAPLAEPLNPPVRDAGLKAPPRLVRRACSPGAR